MIETRDRIRDMAVLIVVVCVLAVTITYVWSVGSATDRKADTVVNVVPPRPDSGDEGFGFAPGGDFTFVQEDEG